MAALTLPLSSAPGAVPGEGTGRLINARVVKDGTQALWISAAGLTTVASPGKGSPRGGLLVGGLLYLAREDTLFSLDSGGTLAKVGRLDGATPVTMARNNRAATDSSGGPDVAIVTDTGAYVVTSMGVVGYPGSTIGTPNDVSFLDGYFLFTYPDSTIRATGTSATPTNTTDMSDQSYTRAESNPDGLLRGTVSGGQFFAWGQNSIEVYSDQALSPFPLGRQQVLPLGLFGKWCIAGYENGWDGPQIFVAADGTVRRLDGYTPNRISTRAVERFIAAGANPNVFRACVYTSGGAAIWSLSAPHGTWEYELGADAWHERRSLGLNRWRAETTVFAFGKWIAGDIVTGDALAVSETTRTEAGYPLIARVESAPLRQIPDRLRLGPLSIDIATGVGFPSSVALQANPSCAVSWSLDGGESWAQSLRRPIGPPGLSGLRVSVADLGRTTREGVRVAVEVSDPVVFSLRGFDLPRVALRKGA